MSRLFLFLLAYLFSVTSLAGQSFADFISQVNSLSDPGDKAAIVDSFMLAVPSFPFIEDSTAHFLYRGTITSAAVAGDFNGWSNTDDPMQQLPGTDLWFLSRMFEWGARLDYKLVLNGSNWVLDPRNPNQVSGGFGPNSELAMPGYVQPWEIQPDPSVPKGTLENFSLYSSETGATYQVKVYLPAGYLPAGGIAYPSAYFQDGFEYVDLGSAPTILDNLIDSLLIPKIVAVFVRPTDRNNEYAFTKKTEYRQFFVNKLVPYVDSVYNTLQAPESRAVIGASFGGNISALISYYHPGLFGKCGLHSGAFWPNNYETYNLIISGPVEAIRYASIWGTYEGGLHVNMQLFTLAMEGKGYSFYSRFLPEGHSWGLWRATLDELLIFLFQESATVLDPEVLTFPGLKVFPNPVSESVRFEMDPFSDLVKVEIFNPKGEVVLSDKIPAGTSGLTLSMKGLSGGTYMYRFESANRSATGILVKP